MKILEYKGLGKSPGKIEYALSDNIVYARYIRGTSLINSEDAMKKVVNTILHNELCRTYLDKIRFIYDVVSEGVHHAFEFHFDVKRNIFGKRKISIESKRATGIFEEDLKAICQRVGAAF